MIPDLAVSPEPTDVAPTEIDVDWERSIGETSPLLAGANDYRLTRLKRPDDSLLHDRVRRIGLTLVRLRYPHMASLLTDSQSRNWDEGSLVETFADPAFAGTARVLAIPTWPVWLKQDRDRLLDPSEYRNYAHFCARLVSVLNIKHQLGIEYFEPLGDLEMRYRAAGQLEELWKIFNIVATAMHLKDPTVKVGGPGSTGFDSQVLGSFLHHCRFNVDFICWNDYAEPHVFDTTEHLMAATPDYFLRVKTAQALVRRAIPGRDVPLMLSEYNIENTSSPYGGRQSGHLGAIWTASVIKHLAEAGLEMAATSHLKHLGCGLIGNDHRLRPLAFVFVWLTRHLCGRVFATVSSNPLVEAMAVTPDEQRRSLLLINKSAQDAYVSLQTREVLKGRMVEVYSLDAMGNDFVRLPSIAIYKRILVMPPYSLKLLLFER
jgi:xylan 1,4-beta-xylosidase